MRTPSRSLTTDAVLALAVLLSRLPFLGPGAGNDNDGWFLVNAAREIAATGRYTTSRFPGYPVQEWLASWIARAGGGPVAMNLLSAIAAAACAFAFARLLRRLGARDVVLAAAALVCVPAAWVASVSAMDYLFAVAFVIAAGHARVSGRSALAGLWLGLAIGTRLTSATLLPAMLLLPPPRPERGTVRDALALIGIALVVGALCYVPAHGRYGWGFLRFVDPLGTGSSPLDFATGFLHLDRLPVPPSLIVGQATALLWGVPGTLALAAAFIAGAFAVARPRARAAGGGTSFAAHAHDPVTTRVLLAAGVAIATQLALYVRLPHDEGYLLPAVPFTLLLASATTPRGWFRAACLAMLVSSFVLGVDVVPPKKGIAPATRSAVAIARASGAYTVVLDPLRGPLLQDHDKRVRATAVVTRVIAARDTMPAGVLLWAGVLCAELTDRLPQDRAHPWYTDYLLEPDLRAALAAGHAVWLLPGVRDRVRRLAGYDPVSAGASEWLAGVD
jgi:hypothetical protein